MTNAYVASAGAVFLAVAVILSIGFYLPGRIDKRTVTYEVRLVTSSETPYTIIVPTLVDHDDNMLGLTGEMAMTVPVALEELQSARGPGLQISGNVSTTISYDCSDCHAELSLQDTSHFPPYHDNPGVYVSSAENFTIELGLTFHSIDGSTEIFMYGLLKTGWGCETDYDGEASHYTTSNWTEMPGRPEGVCWDGLTYFPLSLIIVPPFYVVGFVLLAVGLRRGKDEWLRCPTCGSRDAVQVLYGLPESAAGSVESAVRPDGKPQYVYGGHTATVDSPRWRCNSCGTRFGSLNGPFQ